MAYTKEYTIVLTEDSNFTIKDYNKILQYKNTEYSQLSLASDLKTQTGSFPDRSVTQSFKSAFTRMGNYAFKDSETASLLANPNIQALVPVPTQLDIDIAEGSGSISQSIWIPTKSLCTSIHANFRFQSDSTEAQGVGWPLPLGTADPVYPEYQKGEIGSWHLWWHSLDKDQMFKNGTTGSSPSYTQIYGGETWFTMSGDYSEPFSLANIGNPENQANFARQDTGKGDGSHKHETDIHFTVDGTNVDLLTYEGERILYYAGYISPRINSAMDFNHPEFYGFNGDTRIQFIDWRDYGDEGIPCYYFPSNQHVVGGFPWQLCHHRQMVASTAGGLYNGYAKGANLYFYPGTFLGNQRINDLNTIKHWHASKPINPKTGRKNPTVVNSSLGAYYQRPLYLFECGNKSSGSFFLTGSTYNHLNGFRISHFGKDYIFLSGSGTEIDDYTPEINKRGGNRDLEVKKFQPAVLCYFTGSSHFERSVSLAEKINSTFQNAPLDPVISDIFSASVQTVHPSGLKIHLTSSLEYEVLRPKIYTGHINDFISSASGYLNTSNPEGGNFVTQLTGGLDPNTHIDKIVVKGQLAATGSSLWINARHGFQDLPPYDHYGIDKGFNLMKLGDGYGLDNGFGDHSWSIGPTPTNDLYTGSGVRSSLVQFQNTTAEASGEGGAPYNLPIRIALKELADDGVIWVSAAANERNLVTMRSASGMDYFDEDQYDEDLWNTYLEYDAKCSGDYVIQHYFGPHEPIHFHVTNITDENTMIQVGAIGCNHTPYLPSWGGQFNNGNDMYSNPIPHMQYLTAGYFPIGFSCKGKGVHTYAASTHATMAGDVGVSPQTPTQIQQPLFNKVHVHGTCSFYTTGSNIQFNTSSVTNAYTQSHNNLEFYQNSDTQIFPATYRTQEIDSGPTFNINGPQTTTGTGGTSNAAPRVAGMITCYMQLHPDANTKDVRRWIKANGVSLPTSHDPNRSNYLYHNLLETSSVLGSSSFYHQHIYPSGGDWGPDPRVLNFPYNKNPNPITFHQADLNPGENLRDYTGNTLDIEFINFEL